MSEENGLPDQWVESPIEDLLVPLENGRILHHGWSPQCEKGPSESDNDWGVLKTTAIQDGEYQPEHNKRLPSHLEPRPHLEVKEGDLLLTCAGPRIRCGVACLVKSTRPRLILSGKMYRFRTSDSYVDPRYLEAYLRSPDVQQSIDGMKTGISDSGLNLTHGRFLPLPVRVAPLPEQRRIVAKIEELFSDLDAGVAALQRVKANLKRYRASVLKAAVEGRLTERWRAEHPDTEPADQLLERILTERRRKWEADQLARYKAKGTKPPTDWKDKYKQPAKPDTSKLPKLPEGWCWVSIGQCFRVSVGATPSRREPSYWQGDIPWVSSGEVAFCRLTSTKETISQSGLNNSSTQINPSGSVLVGMIGEGKTRGQCAILDIPAANNQNCAAIWVSTTPVIPEYVYYWLRSQYEVTRQMGSGNNQPALNKSRVEEITFPLAPIQEQQSLVEAVEAHLSILDKCDAELEPASLRATRLRQSILKRAFEGKLVPQDPADEPAQALLARIAEQRANATPMKKSKSHKTLHKKGVVVDA